MRKCSSISGLLFLKAAKEFFKIIVHLEISFKNRLLSLKLFLHLSHTLSFVFFKLQLIYNVLSVFAVNYFLTRRNYDFFSFDFLNFYFCF